jgi:hypothetical protein
MSTHTNAPLMTRSGSPPFRSSMHTHLTTYVAFLQGIYYVLTGIWPLFSIDTFQMVTGSKTDLWLVQTVGVLIAVIGAVLLTTAWRRCAAVEVILLALGSAAALGAVDVVFVVRRVIAPIYLLDAAAEVVLVLMWLLAWTIEVRTRGKRHRRGAEFHWR